MFKMTHKITYLAALSLSVLQHNNGTEHTIAVLTGVDGDFAHYRWVTGEITGHDGILRIVPTEVDGEDPTGRWERIGGLGNAKLFSFVAPAAQATASVHALYDGTNEAFPGPFTNPDTPRNVGVRYTTGWDGGPVTINGTNQFDEPVSETLVSSPGGTVAGVKIFKTVTGATKGIPAGVAGTGASIGWGNKLGLPERIISPRGLVTADGIADDATFDATYHYFVPVTAPDGVVSYNVIVNTL